MVAVAAARFAASSSRTRPHSRGSAAPAPAVPAGGGTLDKLERFLSKAGVLSRTEARVRVRKGDVTVNGNVTLDPWFTVQTGRDRVEVVGFGAIGLPDWTKRPPSVVLFNKPKGVVVTLNANDKMLKSNDALSVALPSPWREKLAPHVPALRPVGRLDGQSMGLLLLTDSSQLGARLTTPGGCQKEYLVRVRPAPTEDMLRRLRDGLEIPDGNSGRGPTQPCSVEIVEGQGDGESGVVLRFRIEEGRNRQLRRMCGVVGLHVTWLIRMRVGPLELGRLKIGQARDATSRERDAILEMVGML